MLQTEIIKGCNILVATNKGISLKEQYTLMQVPRILVTDYKVLSNIELVSLTIKVIYTSLGRKNITPRDLKKAVVNMIEL